MSRRQPSRSVLLVSIVCCVVLSTLAHNDYEPEPHKWRQNPDKLPGSYQMHSKPEGACNETCTIPARVVLDRFLQYKYFDYYTYIRDDVSIYPFERAGIRHCEEAEEIMQCYEDCNRNQTLLGLAEDLPVEVIYVKRLIQKYCEKQYTPGYPHCRLADVRGCDSLLTKAACGEQLEYYEQCVDLTIQNTHQDCSGFCTPARRFYQASRFMWRMECRLKQAAQTQCSTLVSFTCFNKIKDTDTNFGLYEEFHLNETYTNDMSQLCGIFEEAFSCMDQTVYGWFDYYGFNITQPCSDIETEIAEIQAEWRVLIAPFCNNSATQDLQTWTFEDVCPEPAALPPVSSTPHYHPVFTSPTSTSATRAGVPSDEGESTTIVTKSGSCPSSDLTKDCVAFCTNDGECPGSQKCCDNCCRRIKTGQPITKSNPIQSGKSRKSGGLPTSMPGLLLPFMTILSFLNLR